MPSPAFGEPPAASWGLQTQGNPILGDQTGRDKPPQIRFPALRVAPLWTTAPNAEEYKQWALPASLGVLTLSLPSPPPRVSTLGTVSRIQLELLSEHPSYLPAAPSLWVPQTTPILAPRPAEHIWPEAQPGLALAEPHTRHAEGGL